MIRPDFWAQPQAPFTEEVLEAAGRHAAAEAPNESCGLVRAGKYVACENVSEEPWHEFIIASGVVAEAMAAGDLEGVIHSHPGGPWYPTKADVEGQIATAVPWAILIPGEENAQLACHWGGERPPVFDANGNHVQRKFRHYVADCYSLMEDYYREVGVDLPKVPRDWNWWKTQDDLYTDHLEVAGFDIVSKDPMEFASVARPQDAILFAIRSNGKPNHAAAYLGGGLMLDHVPRRLSRVINAQEHFKTATHLLRFIG